VTHHALHVREEFNVLANVKLLCFALSSVQDRVEKGDQLKWVVLKLHV
jgi:hypothetical protein